jgi:hypothetical protein
MGKRSGENTRQLLYFLNAFGGAARLSCADFSLNIDLHNTGGKKDRLQVCPSVQEPGGPKIFRLLISVSYKNDYSLRRD